MRRTDNGREAVDVIAYYNGVLDRLARFPRAVRGGDKQFEERKRELYWTAIQAERDKVQSLYEQGDITRETAGKLRAMIREREAATFELGEIG